MAGHGSQLIGLLLCIKMSVCLITLFAYILHLVSNKARDEKSEAMAANDQEDSTNIVDSYFHLIIGTCLFIATVSILLLILLIQKSYLRSVLQRELYDRKINELQVKIRKVEGTLQEMMALREEMNRIKSNHMQIVDTVIDSLRKEQDILSLDKGNEIQPMNVEEASIFDKIDLSNKEHRKNDMKCENTSEQMDYNIDNDQFINKCDIRQVQEYNRAFILRKLNSDLKLGGKTLKENQLAGAKNIFKSNGTSQIMSSVPPKVHLKTSSKNKILRKEMQSEDLDVIKKKYPIPKEPNDISSKNETKIDSMNESKEVLKNQIETHMVKAISTRSGISLKVSAPKSSKKKFCQK